MGRRGRKKIAKARRRLSPSQREPIVVLPTDEQITKKARLLGVRIETLADKLDVIKRDTSTPLAVLRARGLITEDQYNAGVTYASLYWRHIGSPYPAIGSYRDVARGSVRGVREDDPEADERLEKLFNRLADRLDEAGLAPKRAVGSICVDGELPSDVSGAEGLGKSRWPLETLRRGLEALCGFSKPRKTTDGQTD